VKSILKILNWLAVFLVPIILVLSTVGIMLTPVFIQIEYRLPGFPADPYGFTLEERLYWADISRQYLVNREGINFLAEQKLDPQTPLYNERELKHMLDVKIVVQGALWLLSITFLLQAVIGYLNKRNDDILSYLQALSKGGWLTTLLIVGVLVYLALNFDSLFTNFHRIFFEGDSWLFRYSDTLIRLFPIRFWRDAFIWISVMGLAGGASLGYFCAKPRKE
jgi:integral membrane protein (TIGR01906 family)